MLHLPQATLQKINEDATAAKPGVTTLRVAPLDATTAAAAHPPTPPYAREVLGEVGFVCKKCRLAYPSEAGLLGHQRTACYPGKDADNRGAIRLTQAVYECKICPAADKAKSVTEFRQHCDGDSHKKNMNAAMLHPPAVPARQQHHARQHHLPVLPSPPASVSPSTGLTHEMEDVVNQITLLAARAAAESTPGVAVAITDSNANIAGETKRAKMFLHPAEALSAMAVSSTGQ